MIYKINFSISGNLLNPEKLKILSNDCIIESYNSPTDKKFEHSDDAYGYGNILFWHPKKFSTETNILDYEEWFVEFLEKNHQLILDCGGENFEFYLELYYDGGQCNFEIFNRDLLKRIATYNVSVPISIYVLGENELQEWTNEIDQEWTLV